VEARRAAEVEARRAADEARRAALADAAATRPPQRLEPPTADLPVPGRPVDALRPADLPAAAPPVADKASASVEIAEPSEQAEAVLEADTRLPIYRWFDPPPKLEDAPDLTDS
jgi:hypothetical protein